MTPHARLPLLARTALLGLATGGRSSAGVVALSWSSGRDDPAPLNLLAGRRGRAAAGLFGAGELLVDKLPQAPSRLLAGPLTGRVLAGAAGGIGLASRSAGVPLGDLPVRALLPGAIVGAGAAFAGSHLGSAWRRRAPFRQDVVSALVEDTTVVALATAAVTG